MRECVCALVLASHGDACIRASSSSSEGMHLLRDRASICRTKINRTLVHATRMHVRTRTYIEYRSDTYAHLYRI
jgi:hypothetical protein